MNERSKNSRTQEMEAMEPAFHGCSSVTVAGQGAGQTMVLMWFGCSGHCGHADATCTGLFTVDIMGFSVFKTGFRV